MNFHDFQQFRSELLTRDPSIVDLAETNLWRSLSDMIPQIQRISDVHIHRCHLATAWLDVFGLPGQLSKYTMITCGVRHSLSLLFPILAERNGTLVMPSDVYPVYGQLAEASDLAPSLFPTVPELRLPEHGDWLLLPNPLKPAGRWLSQTETDSLKQWLAQNSKRRILIDAVYNFRTQIHPITQALLETQQAILMHSLSKAWLHPKVMGVCIVPETDWDSLAIVFRNNSPDQSCLQIADTLLRSHRNLPISVDHALTARRLQLLQSLPTDIATERPHDGSERAGYFIPLNAAFEALLKTHHILTIPLSVFGSAEQGVAIASTL